MGLSCVFKNRFKGVNCVFLNLTQFRLDFKFNALSPPTQEEIFFTQNIMITSERLWQPESSANCNWLRMIQWADSSTDIWRSMEVLILLQLHLLTVLSTNSTLKCQNQSMKTLAYSDQLPAFASRGLIQISFHVSSLTCYMCFHPSRWRSPRLQTLISYWIEFLLSACLKKTADVAYTYL